MKKKEKNRRITYRDTINIIGKIVITYNEKRLEESIHIINISLKGAEIVFANNNFLFEYLATAEREDAFINIEFELNEINYSFPVLLKWVRIFSLGEREFYTMTGVIFVDIENIKSQLVDILLLLQTQNFYIK